MKYRLLDDAEATIARQSPKSNPEPGGKFRLLDDTEAAQVATTAKPEDAVDVPNPFKGKWYDTVPDATLSLASGATSLANFIPTALQLATSGHSQDDSFLGSVNRGMTKASDALGKVSQAFQDSKSEKARYDINSNPVVYTKSDGSLAFNMPNWEQIKDVGIASAAPGVAITKGGQLLTQGANMILKNSPKLAAMLGFGAANTAFVTPQTYDQARRTAYDYYIQQEKLSPQEADLKAQEAAEIAATITAPVSALTGAPGGIESRLQGSLLKRMVQGAGIEMLPEAAEEYTQSASTDIGIGRPIDQADALSQAFMAGFAGGTQGAITAGMEGGSHNAIDQEFLKAAAEEKATGANPFETKIEGGPGKGAITTLNEPVMDTPEAKAELLRLAREKLGAPETEGDGSAAAPKKVENLLDMAEATLQAKEPTEAQKEAGNYKKAHVKVGGLNVTIETPAGAKRSGVDAEGNPWEVEMPADYGYVKRSKGADGEQMDVYIGPNPKSDKVFVIDQYDAETKKFDEHKAMLGYDSAEQASADYNKAFSDGRGPERAPNAPAEMSLQDFKQWLKKPQKKPVVNDTNVVNKKTENLGTSEGRAQETNIEEQMATLEREHDAAGTTPERKAAIKTEMDALANQRVQEIKSKEVMQNGERQTEAEGGQRRQGEADVLTDKPPADAGGSSAKISDVFAGNLEAGGKFDTITQARQLVEMATGEKVKPNTVRAKEIDEEIEHGITKAARNIVQDPEGGTTDQKYDKLVDLYERQPILAVRTSTSREMQAYSTPAPIAYVASRLADITPDSVVYEPTAGHGMLLMESNPQKTYANELDAERALRLKENFNTTRKDALNYNPDQKVDRIIANPPFGKIEGGNVKTPQGLVTDQIDQAIMLKSLESLKDNGKAVYIIGGKKGDAAARQKAYNSKSQRAFLKKLYDNYNVTRHFTISGDMYKKQGAAWPIDVIVIDGKGKSALPYPSVQAPKMYENFDQLKEVLTDARVQPAERIDDSSSAVAEATNKDEGRVSNPPAEKTAPADNGSVGAGSQAGNRGDAGAGGKNGLPGPAEKSVGGKPGGKQSGTEERGEPGAGGARVPSEMQREPGAPKAAAKPDAGRDTGKPDTGKNGRTGLNQAYQELQQLKPDEIDSLVDDVMADLEKTVIEETREIEKKARSLEPIDKKTASKEVKKAVQQAAAGSSEWMDGLVKLFADPNKFSAGLTFDEQSYIKAKPHFKAGLDYFIQAGNSLKEAVRLLAQSVRDVFGDKLNSYLKKFLSELQTMLQQNQSGVVEAKPKPKFENTEKETDYQVRYEPTSSAKPVGTLIPVNMQASLKAALDDLTARVGNIDSYVAEKLGYDNLTDVTEKYFSAEQVEALALAIDNLETGSGFIIGDQTGVGKGRFVAGIMRYAIQQGRIPIFVTRQPGLYSDMYRDTYDIGLKDFNAMVTNGDLRGDKIIDAGNGKTIQSMTPAKMDAALKKMLESGTIPEGYDALFTTYSQLQTVKGKAPLRVSAIEAIAPNAILVLDESHEAGGQKKTFFKIKDPESGEEMRTRASIVRDIIDASAGTVYSSATYAKSPDVMDLYRKTDMRLAVEKIEDLAGAINAGGIPMQQVVSNMLVQRGQYRRAERSYDGVRMDMNTVASDVELAERATSLLRKVYEFDLTMKDVRDVIEERLKQEAEAMAFDNSKGEAGINSVSFSATLHNLVGQMLFSLKAQSTAELAIAAAKEGRKPVIAIANTMESLLSDYIDATGIEKGDSLADFNFNRIFKRYLRRTREYTIAGDKKNGVTAERKFIGDEELNDIGFSRLVDMYKEVEQAIEETDLSSLSPSPIDVMMKQLQDSGFSVGEITGRSRYIDTDGNLAERKASEAEKKKVMNGFNGGTIDALIINKSGSTGYSLHASEKYKDKRQRHMFVVQADPNIDTFMQMLGRIHRTGQVELPRYDIVVSDMPAEKRLAANLMRKMASLNANTTANRDSAVTINNVVDFINKYGDDITAEMLMDDPELARTLDLRSEYETEEAKQGLANKLTGRLSILPIKQQEEIYKQLEKSYLELIDRLNQLGENALMAKTLELDAQPLGSTIVFKGQGNGNPFTEDANLVEFDVKRLGKPYQPSDVARQIQENRGEKTQSDFMGELKEKLSDGVKKREEEIDREITEAKAHLETTKEKVKAQGKEIDPKLTKLSKTLDRKLGGLQTERANLQELLRYTYAMLDTGRLGGIVTVSKTDDASHSYEGVVTNLTYDSSKPGLSLGKGKITIAVADATREIQLTFSQVVDRGKVPAKWKLIPSRLTDKEFDQLLESGQTQSREKRHIITGNIFAGFAKMPKGQITFFTDNQGVRQRGVLMPRSFNAQKELSNLAENFDNGQQLVDFVKKVNGLGRAAGIESADGGLKIFVTNEGNIQVEANAKHGKPYYHNKSVRKEFGDFVGRSSSAMRLKLQGFDQLAKLIDTYMDELGAHFETKLDQGVLRNLKGIGQESPNEGQFSVEYNQRFSGDLDTIKTKTLEIVRRMNPNVKVRLVDELWGDGEGLMRSGLSSTERQRVSGVYSRAHNLIQIALNNGIPSETAYHEAWHSIEQFLLPEEQALLQKSYPGDGKVTHDEQAAYAYQKWAMRKEQNQSAAIRRIFAKIRRFLKAMGNMLRGRGFRTVEDIFEGAYKGDIGLRGKDIFEAAGEITPERRAADAADDRKYSVSPPSVRKDNLKEMKVIDRVMVADDHRSIFQRARDMLDEIKRDHSLRFRTAFIDNLAPIAAREKEKYGKLLDASVSAFKFARMSRGIPKLMQLSMGIKTRDGYIGGRVRYNPEKGTTEIIPNTKPFLAIFEPIAQMGPDMMRLWEGWAIANRSQRLIQEGRENLLSQKDIDTLLALGKKFPQFQEVMDEWQEFNKSFLDMAEQAGLIDPKSRALWERNDYVPFYRVLDDGADVSGPKRKNSLFGQRSGIRQLKGGEAQIGSVIENMVMNVSKLLDASVKNIAAQRIDELFSDSLAWEDAGKHFVPATISAADAAKKLRMLGVDVEKLSPDQKSEWMRVFQIVPPKDKDVVSFMRDGKVQYRRVYDPLLLNAVNALGEYKMHRLLEILGAPKRWLTAGVTASPEFILRNFVRDTLSTTILSDTKLVPFASAAKGFITALTNGQEYIEMMAHGSGFGGFYDSNPKTIKKRLQKMGNKTLTQQLISTPKDAWHAYQRIGEAAEQANRVAIYRSLRKQGVSEAEAAYQARDILDFGAHGGSLIAQILTQISPFLNPRIQGLDKIYRAYMDSAQSAKEKGRKLPYLTNNVMLKGMVLAAATMALTAVNLDDDRYKDLDQWDKDMYYHFFIGDSHFVLPKPFEIGALFSTVPERIMLNVAGVDDWKDSAAAAGRMIFDTLAFNPIGQLKPIVEQVANYNFFTGAPIVPMSKEGLMPEEQYTDNTPRTLIGISHVMPDFMGPLKSPARMDAALRGFFGAMPNYIMAATDVVVGNLLDLPPKASPRLDEMPLLKAFVREEPAKSTKWMSKFYDLKEQSDQLYSTVKHLTEQGRIDEAVELSQKNQGLVAARKHINKMYNDLKEINDKIDDIRNSRSMTPQEKQREKDLYLDQRNKTVKQVEGVLDVIEQINEQPAKMQEEPKPVPLSQIKKEQPELYALVKKSAPAKGRVLDLYRQVLQS